jgi:hypothetical protein
MTLKGFSPLRCFYNVKGLFVLDENKLKAFYLRGVDWLAILNGISTTDYTICMSASLIGSCKACVYVNGIT